MIAYKYVAKCDFFLGDFFVNEGDTVHLDIDLDKALHLDVTMYYRVCINGVLAFQGEECLNAGDLKEYLEKVHCRGDFNEEVEKEMKKSPPIGEGGTGVRVIDNESILLYSVAPKVSRLDPERVELRLEPEIEKGEIISVEGELFKVYDSIVMIKAVAHEN